MPKFSAYMRGEEGPQGDVGQAVLLNGIVSSSSELPPNTQNQKNLVYYVGNNEDNYHLYVYTTTEEQWRDLGSIKGTKGDTGLAAGFAINQNYEIFAVDPDAEPQISIIPDPNSPDTAKIFNFTFGLPRGQNAGFNQNQNIEIENVDSVQEMYASVSTDENSPNTAKIFNFKFGIPRGEAADFGEPTASISTISSLSTASVSITSSGSATSKIFDFHFNIPQGQKGDRGDSFSIYEPVAFTTGSEYWVDNTTFVYPRGDNSKLPIYIYNEDTDELDNSSFTYTTTNIIYNVQQPFNGTLYLMAGANRPTINIGEVSTTSFDGQMSASLNERSTSSDAIIDFTLAKGPDGEPGGFGEVTSTAELIPSASTYVEKDNIVSFSTDYDINNIIVDIEPIQEGSGDPSPENIRPILGWSDVNIYVSPTLSTEDATVYPISWSTQAGTVYGGSLDVTTGMLTVTHGQIASYNAETLPGKWISDRDVYAAETAPTIGAQVVYEFAIPQTYQLTPTQITALLGQNNIWANTGDIQVSYNKFNQPYVEITTDEDSPNTAKRFNFHFGIPQGEKGAPGDAFAIYEPLSFTTGSSYWMGTTLVVPRGDNNKLPLFIYNRDNNNIAATFKLENNYIRHDADSPFNGTLYMMSQTNRSTLRIGNVSTTTYGNGSHFSLNEASTSTDAIFDVVLEQGPRGTTALSAQVGRVSYTSGIPNVEIEGEQDLVFNFDLPRGFKGEKGDTFTVDVDETIDVLGYDETPVVETTSTSTGIALKFKLPPSVSAQLGDLSQYNFISLTSELVRNILPVNKGGTSAGSFTANAILLGNGTNSFKQKATSAGVFYASGNNVEPGFGILPITYGGTGTTTAAEAWTALGGGSIGKLNSLTANNIPVLDASKITTGTFNTDRIPNLNASKITTGTLNTNIIPDLSASKIISGTLNADRIPSLDTSKITSGTFVAARIPSLDASKITSGTFAAARIPSLSYLPLTGGTLTGILTLHREGTTVNNYPSGIAFSNKDTTIGGSTSNAHIYAYHDHANPSYGMNLVISPAGNLFIGSGESADNLYALHINDGNENMFIVSDGTIDIQANSQTVANRVGVRVDTSGNLVPVKADVVTNNIGSIGTSSYRWANIYSTNLFSTNIAGANVTGDLLFTNSGTNLRQIRFLMGDNDYGRIAVGATAQNAGWMEIATADDANEPIYVRQYNGTFTSITRTLTLLDASGNTTIPGKLILSNVMYGTSKPSSLLNGQLYFVYES